MIELKHISHRYRHRRSLVDISCEFGPGIWGLLGPNGAGKTTLLSILATLRQPESGCFLVNGIDAKDDRDAIREIIAFLPQRFSLPSQFRILRVVEYAAWARGIEPEKCCARACAALDRVGLLDRADERVRALSGGMRQRLGIACATVGDPALLLLDEPTVGLDPASRIGVRSLLGELAEDRTVIVSTHLLEDLQGFVSQLVVLSEGKLIFQGSYTDLESVGREHRVRDANDAESGYLTLLGEAA
ncbi:ABC transporter ATP-binding protein [Cutibacterium sp.]|uniref:ABC transporter ATP-binding protein n=1 Tax=Cutibacterium sp. TaxID=1912221 RepID=UPI0026DD7C1D|nr:ABC transporter ATP-binding protein [Cutibacterium sp.]MDO4412334.1 ABC transporter ATP-binding protein [Cutibacterium sp.]